MIQCKTRTKPVIIKREVHRGIKRASSTCRQRDNDRQERCDAQHKSAAMRNKRAHCFSLQTHAYNTKSKEEERMDNKSDANEQERSEWKVKQER